MRRGSGRLLVIAIGIACLAGGCTSNEQPTARSSESQSDEDAVGLYMSYVNNCEWSWVLGYGGKSWRLDEPTTWAEADARTGVVMSSTESELLYRDNADGSEVRFVPYILNTVCS